jgi:hypothetical protein
VEDIVDAGRELLAVKSSISRDQFIKWVEDEVGISQSTAYRWMSLTRRPSILRLRNLTPDLAARGRGHHHRSSPTVSGAIVRNRLRAMKRFPPVFAL